MRDTTTKTRHLRNQILIGDARNVIDQVADASVDTVITSPPYFRLRDYQQPNQIGLESQVEQWVDQLLVVARGLRRVLKPTGSVWLNLGDTFARASAEGATTKSLLLAPERLALAMCKDGWILRNKVVWAKPNPMPTSVRDRLSCTWEVVYFFSREQHYFFDLDAIRVPHVGTNRSPARKRQPRPSWSVPKEWRGPSAGSNGGLDRLKASGLAGHPLGKNPGDVWTFPTANYHGAHHAVFPERLVERPLLATCPERTCATCGTPWTRLPARSRGPLALVGNLRKSCACRSRDDRPGIVLDPFIGAGTTAVVAECHGRDWLGIELNRAFASAATDRITTARKHRRAA
jgi:site-specific DNA-methyltransferase (adenine-specific)